jgi:Tfp pilus assembly protein PilO
MEKIATLTTLDQKLAKLKERVDKAQQQVPCRSTSAVGR